MGIAGAVWALGAIAARQALAITPAPIFDYTEREISGGFNTPVINPAPGVIQYSTFPGSDYSPTDPIITNTYSTEYATRQPVSFFITSQAYAPYLPTASSTTAAATVANTLNWLSSNKVPLNYVMTDFEPYSPNTQANVVAQVNSVVTLVRGYSDSNINSAYIGNYADYPGGPNDSLYRSSGLNIAMPNAYAYSYYETETGDPNPRSAMFYNPLNMITVAKNALPTGNLLIPWLSSYIPRTGYPDTPPPLDDIAATITSARMRGADGYYGFINDVSSSSWAWTDLNFIYHGTSTGQILNLSTNQSSGFQWSGYSNGANAAFIFDNLGNSAGTVTLPTITGIPGSSPIVPAGTHVEEFYINNPSQIGSDTIYLGRRNINGSLFVNATTTLSNPIVLPVSDSSYSSVVTIGSNLSTTGSPTFSGTVSLGNNAVLQTMGKTLTVSGVISGTGGITTTGGGMVILSAFNIYSGGTTVSGETLLPTVASTTVGNGTAMTITNGALGVGPLIVNGGVVDLSKFSVAIGGLGGVGGDIASSSTTVAPTLTIVTGATPQTYSGVIANNVGSGAKPISVVIAGGGIQTLAGANSYTGGTNVSSGTLVASGLSGLPTTGAVIVGSTATLSTIDGTSKNISVGSLNLAAGCSLNLDYISGATDKITSTDAVTASGVIKISLTAITPQAGTYTLLSAPSGLSGSGLSFELVNNTNYTGSISSSSTAVSMNGASATALANAYWFGGQVTAAASSMAISSGTTSNWARLATDTSATAAGVIPGSMANVFFSTNTGATQESNITLGANMTFNSVTFSDKTPVTISSDGNTLTLLSTGTGTSSAISANKTATINANIALSGAQTWTVASGAILNVGGSISGTSGLTFPGAGTTVLSGQNTYLGITSILAGTLAVGATNSLPIAGTVTIGDSNGAGTGAFNVSSFSQTVSSLTSQSNNTSGTLNKVNIGSGGVLTLNGGLNVGIDLSTTLGIATTSFLTIAGGGSLNVNTSSANLVVCIPQSTLLNSGSFATLDLSGLSHFTFGNSTTGTNILAVGYGGRVGGNLNLSNMANTITASSIEIGNSLANNAGNSSTILLGTGTNVLAANTIDIGAGQTKAGGTLKFASQTGGSAGTLTVTDESGGPTAAINVGSNVISVGTSGTPTGTFDLRGHLANVSAGTVNVGSDFNNGYTGGAAGTLSFDTGTFTAGTLVIGANQSSINGTSNSSGASNGLVTIGGGTFSVGTVAIAAKSNSGIGAAVGTINVSGGTLNIATSFTLVSQIDTATSVGTTTGTLNITGGLVTSNASILNGGGADVGILILNGGTLDLAGNSIGVNVSPITALNFQSGKLQNVAEINGGTTPLVKIGSGTLTLAGTNSYSGGTNVLAGTLILSSATAYPVNTSLNVASGTIVTIANHSSGAVYVPVLSVLTNTGTIDLINNAMILHNGSIGTISTEVTQAFNNGGWNGTNLTSGVITSTLAAANTTHLTAIGVATGFTSFEGNSVLTSDVLVKYTYYGDATLDGKVDGSDYSRIDSGFGSNLTGWYNGDFNYDNIINGSDYTLIDNAFNMQSTHLTDSIADPRALSTTEIAPTVPEPTMLTLLSLAITGALGRRRNSV